MKKEMELIKSIFKDFDRDIDIKETEYSTGIRFGEIFIQLFEDTVRIIKDSFIIIVLQSKKGFNIEEVIKLSIELENIYLTEKHITGSAKSVSASNRVKEVIQENLKEVEIKYFNTKADLSSYSYKGLEFKIPFDFGFDENWNLLEKLCEFILSNKR